MKTFLPTYSITLGMVTGSKHFFRPDHIKNTSLDIGSIKNVRTLIVTFKQFIIH